MYSPVYGRTDPWTQGSPVENVVVVVEQRFYNQVLLHHVQCQVVGDGCSPHQSRSKNDGQIGYMHPVVLAVFRDFEQMSQQILQRVIILGWQ